MLYIYNETNSKTKHNKGRETVHAWRSSQNLQGGDGNGLKTEEHKTLSLPSPPPKRNPGREKRGYSLKATHKYNE